eukprot:jgi/Mesen1/698/ME000109S_10924
MVSDEAIITRLCEILENCDDLARTTVGMLRAQLEDHFKVDLSSKRLLIRSTIEEYLILSNPEAENGGSESEEDEGEDDDGEEEDARKEATVETTNGKFGGSTAKIVGNATCEDDECELSDGLAQLLKARRLPASMALRELWGYITRHKLQDPGGGIDGSGSRKLQQPPGVKCDQALFDLFGVRQVAVADLPRHLAPHLRARGASDDDNNMDNDGGDGRPAPQARAPLPVVQEENVAGVAPRKSGGAGEEKKPATAASDTGPAPAPGTGGVKGSGLLKECSCGTSAATLRQHLFCDIGSVYA